MARKPHETDAQNPADWWEATLRISRQRISGVPWLRDQVEDLANFALQGLAKQMKKETVQNPEGFVSTVIKHRVIDLIASRDAEQERLALLVEEVIRYAKGGGGGTIELLGRNESLRGLSADIIAEEERRLTRLRAAASVAAMPDDEGRSILGDRFYADPPLSISDLARKHGKSPNVMANYLAKVIGSHFEPGAVGPVSEILKSIQLTTAEHYVRILVDFDELSVVTDPFAGAISHLEYIGSRSPEHRNLAATGTARLRWLQRNFPSNRGIGNKILRKLIVASCFYVMEERDALHDRFDPRGLRDDLALLEATFRVVRKHSR